MSLCNSVLNGCGTALPLISLTRTRIGGLTGRSEVLPPGNRNTSTDGLTHGYRNQRVGILRKVWWWGDVIGAPRIAAAPIGWQESEHASWWGAVCDCEGLG